MSTFGKKAINRWDYTYSKENLDRFRKSPVEIQLQILEKWYPIGMVCEKWEWLLKKYSDNKHTINGYTLMPGEYYKIETTSYIGGYKMNNVFNAIELKPTEQERLRILREENLKRLGI